MAYDIAQTVGVAAYLGGGDPDFVDKLLPFSVIFEDDRTRNAINRNLLALGLSSQPFECVSEMMVTGISERVIIAEPSAVAAIHDLMQTSHGWIPYAVLGTDFSVAEIADEIRYGALDVLVFPFGDEILGRLSMISASAVMLRSVKERQFAARRAITSLTRREREVLFALDDGNSAEKIAKALAISPRTVEIHRANMKSKLGVKTLMGAIKVLADSCLTE